MELSATTAWTPANSPEAGAEGTEQGSSTGDRAREETGTCCRPDKRETREQALSDQTHRTHKRERERGGGGREREIERREKEEET